MHFCSGGTFICKNNVDTDQETSIVQVVHYQHILIICQAADIHVLRLSSFDAGGAKPRAQVWGLRVLERSSERQHSAVSADARAALAAAAQV